MLKVKTQMLLFELLTLSQFVKKKMSFNTFQITSDIIRNFKYTISVIQHEFVFCCHYLVFGLSVFLDMYVSNMAYSFQKTSFRYELSARTAILLPS